MNRTAAMHDPLALQKKIEEAVFVLKRGGVIAYPTETVYGLGGDATREDTIDRIYEIKGRAFRNPLLILVADHAMLASVVKTVPVEAKKLMAHFWPGPLTIIFKAASHLPSRLTAGTGKVGVRISPDPVCMKLMQKFNKPLISTSANRTGDKPALTAETVQSNLGSLVDLIIDDGPRTDSASSTVIDVTESSIQVIREGVVPRQEIFNIPEG